MLSFVSLTRAVVIDGVGAGVAEYLCGQGLLNSRFEQVAIRGKLFFQDTPLLQQPLISSPWLRYPKLPANLFWIRVGSPFGFMFCVELSGIHVACIFGWNHYTTFIIERFKIYELKYYAKQTLKEFERLESWAGFREIKRWGGEGLREMLVGDLGIKWLG